MYEKNTKIYQNNKGFCFELKNTSKSKQICISYISYLIHVDKCVMLWNNEKKYKKSLKGNHKKIQKIILKKRKKI